jgi:hypothetical protein
VITEIPVRDSLSVLVGLVVGAQLSSGSSVNCSPLLVPLSSLSLVDLVRRQDSGSGSCLGFLFFLCCFL